MINAIPKNKSPTPGFRTNIKRGSTTSANIRWCMVVAKNTIVHDYTCWYFPNLKAKYNIFIELLYWKHIGLFTLIKEWIFWYTVQIWISKLVNMVKSACVGNEIGPKYPKIYFNSFAPTSINNIGLCIVHTACIYNVYPSQCCRASLNNWHNPVWNICCRYIFISIWGDVFITNQKLCHEVPLMEIK